MAATVAKMITSVTPTSTSQGTATLLTGTTNILPSASGVVLAASNPAPCP